MTMVREPTMSQREAPPRESFSVAWLSLGVVPLAALITTLRGSSTALVVVAVASLSGGLAIFVSHGGRRLTAAGIYSLTAGIMTGAGCWYWSGEPPVATTRISILIAGLSIYTATSLMYLLFWRRSLHGLAAPLEARAPIPPQWAHGVVLLGLALFVIGAATKAGGASLGTLAQATAEVGVILFAAALLLSGDVRGFQSPLQTVAISVALVAFYLLIFSGGGRLRLVTLVITVAVIGQYRLRTPVKMLAVAALIPTIVIFGAIGRSRVADQAADPNYQASAAGLGSLVNPLATYGQLIDKHISSGHGSTFVAEAVVLVPRSVWPGKPVQFGQVLVERLHPEAVGRTNLSVPAMNEGEWYYNFSWLGLALLVLSIGWLLRYVDRRIARVDLTDSPHPGPVFQLVLLATLIGSISDLAWGGLGTWEVRNAQRLVILVPLLVVWYLVPRQPRVESSSAHPAR